MLVLALVLVLAARTKIEHEHEHEHEHEREPAASEFPDGPYFPRTGPSVHTCTGAITP